MGAGDSICQAIAHGGVSLEGWDKGRSARMAFIGAFITGPCGHCWQLVLESLLPGTGVRLLVAKTAANAGFALVFSLPLIFTATTLLTPMPPTPSASSGGGDASEQVARGSTLADAKAKIETDLLPTFVMGMFYWPMANMVVFKFCPVDRRAVVNSLFGVLWNVRENGSFEQFIYKCGLLTKTGSGQT
jgi:hypothetical protein|eukprot:COSAG06_NODE_10707_length_1631_cov_1.933420_2_plen_188_part_00